MNWLAQNYIQFTDLHFLVDFEVILQLKTQRNFRYSADYESLDLSWRYLVIARSVLHEIFSERFLCMLSSTQHTIWDMCAFCWFGRARKPQPSQFLIHNSDFPCRIPHQDGWLLVRNERNDFWFFERCFEVTCPYELHTRSGKWFTYNVCFGYSLFLMSVFVLPDTRGIFCVENDDEVIFLIQWIRGAQTWKIGIQKLLVPIIQNWNPRIARDFFMYEIWILLQK